jgi:hypothetical protein
VFLVNSRHPLACAPQAWLPRPEAPFSRSYGGNLPSSFSTVLSNAWVCSTSPPVSVSGTVLTLALFPGRSWLPPQSDKGRQRPTAVTSSRPRNVDLVPIGYGFRPRLRGRLTLRGLALRRNPWTFGGSVSHTPCRYSCQHSHFRHLHTTSRSCFAGNGTLRYHSRGQRSEVRDQKTIRADGTVKGRPASWRSPDTPDTNGSPQAASIWPRSRQ